MARREEFGSDFSPVLKNQFGKKYKLVTQAFCIYL